MEIKKILEDLRRCASMGPACRECNHANSNDDCITNLTNDAAETIVTLQKKNDVWAERWAEEHNARLRAEENAADFNRIRNELCDRCGNYKDAHNGACKGCRWEDK